jgi:hypothetical protein
MAETVDRLEQELLGAVYPTVREKKHVQISFGEPVPLPKVDDGTNNPTVLTNRIEAAVQGMLDMMNREHPVRFEPK